MRTSDDVAHVVVLRTAALIIPANGSHLRFDPNACVILNDKKDPNGSRILGPGACESGPNCSDIYLSGLGGSLKYKKKQIAE
jgi:ribosomal protein L14